MRLDTAARSSGGIVVLPRRCRLGSVLLCCCRSSRAMTLSMFCNSLRSSLIIWCRSIALTPVLRQLLCATKCRDCDGIYIVRMQSARWDPQPARNALLPCEGCFRGLKAYLSTLTCSGIVAPVRSSDIRAEFGREFSNREAVSPRM